MNNKKEYKTVSDIKKEYGSSFTELCNEFFKEGYSISEISRILNLKAPSSVTSGIRQEAELKKKSENKLNRSEKENYSRLKLKQFENKFYANTGIELKVFIKQKYVEEKWSLRELTEYFGRDLNNFIKTMKIYGIKIRNLSESRISAIETGKINYSKINAKSRKSTLKARYNNVLNNYTPQEMFRDYIKEAMENYFIENNIRHFEVIIGFNNWGILFDSEVDIPIVIFNSFNGKYMKFSIEYSGKLWHEVREEVDSMKKERLLLKGWIHFDIIEYRNNTNEDIINNAKDTVNRIIPLLKKIE
jgi:hypothetical protein